MKKHSGGVLSLLWSQRTCLCGLFAGLILAVGGGLGSALALEALPSTAKPITAAELYMLYHDKTWVWKSGGARFIAKNRRFLAWSKNKDVESYAEGRFVLTNDGRVCLRAVWKDGTYSVADRTCFYHFLDRGQIYQRREDTQDWYLFKSSDEEGTGEYAKFFEKDTITDEVARIRDEVSKKPKPIEGEQK